MTITAATFRILPNWAKEALIRAMWRPAQNAFRQGSAEEAGQAVAKFLGRLKKLGLDS